MMGRFFKRGEQDPFAKVEAILGHKAELADFFQAGPVDGGAPVRALNALCLDFETSGLDPFRDQIISVGYVPILGGAIRLGAARHHLVAANVAMRADNVVVHGLTEDQLKDGRSLDAVMADLLAAAAGLPLVVHAVDVERSFLDRWALRRFGQALPFRFIDTMALEMDVVGRPDVFGTGGDDLRLYAARQRYGLPDYRNHHALTDALACGELLLAQLAQLEAGLTVSDIMVKA